MSLDIYLTTRGGSEVFSANMTHNVSPMWRKAGCYSALYESDGKPAKDVLPELVDGYCAMFRDPEGYRPLNPANGWGSYESALEFLAAVIAGFRRDPEEIVRVSR